MPQSGPGSISLMSGRVGLVAGGTRSLLRRGVKTTSTLVREEIQRHLYLRDVHLWYALQTKAERPRFELRSHLRLVSGGPDDVQRMLDLPTISPERARARLAAGAELWLVLDDQDRTAFACWIFHGATPVLAAPDGMLPLPDGVASLEDSVTSPDHRGQGVAPATWERVADALAARDIPTMLTTVGADNAPSRKAVKKVGFDEFAAVRFTRKGPLRRVEVWSTPGTLGDHLRTSLNGVAPAEPWPVELPAAA
jgi:ribosomal protein S18 acetylase RimI-like enzyme